MKEWNADHPDEKVKLVYNGGNDNTLQKTVAGFTAGNYPDVGYQFGSSDAQLARQPKLVDLTETVKKPDFKWDDFYPSEREAATVDGKVVGVPALVDNLVAGLQQGHVRGRRRAAAHRGRGPGTTSAAPPRS